VVTRRVPLVGHDNFRLPEDMSSLPVYSEVRVTRSLVLIISHVEEDIDDTKGVIRIRKSNKDRQHNGQK
jgi:hypothetical protein